MPTLTRRPPSLHPALVELDAFACTDAAGNLHWVRVFEPAIIRRGRNGAARDPVRRLETPGGASVVRAAGGRYLVWSPGAMEWVEVEPVAPARAAVA